MIELAQLRPFVGVAEGVHFSRAAARMFITQPALSRRMRALENSLGIELFNRGHRRVNLTPAGRELLQRARTILADTVAAEAAARSVSQEELRPVSIAFTPSATLRAMPQMLRALNERQRDTRFSVRSAVMAPSLDALRRGTLDVAVVDQRPVDVALSALVLSREPLFLALPVRHPLAAGGTRKWNASHYLTTGHGESPSIVRTFDLRALASEPFVVFPRLSAPGVIDAIMQSCQAVGFIPRIAHEAQTPLDALAMVASELGIAIVPRPRANIWPSDTVWVALSASPAPPLEIEFTVVWRDDNDHPAFRSFKELITGLTLTSTDPRSFDR